MVKWFIKLYLKFPSQNNGYSTKSKSNFHPACATPHIPILRYCVVNITTEKNRKYVSQTTKYSKVDNGKWITSVLYIGNPQKIVYILHSNEFKQFRKCLSILPIFPISFSVKIKCIIYNKQNAPLVFPPFFYSFSSALLLRAGRPINFIPK